MNPMYSGHNTLERPTNLKASRSWASNPQTVKVGFPIRRSPDQRVLAPPRCLSQRATSFIASQRQGIRQKPLLRLIVLSKPHADRPASFEDGARRMRFVFARL